MRKKNDFLQAFQDSSQLLAMLMDPDKVDLSKVENLVQHLPKATTHLFVGGSEVEEKLTEELVVLLKKQTELPIIIFPGDYTQITNEADALLFLSLLSGRNPEFLIEQQVKSVEKLKNTSLEIIPTAYLLIDGGKETSVQRVSQTLPMAQENIQAIVNTALAGEYSGKQLIYLEAGSGASTKVSTAVISAVKKEVSIPIIVGGGIRSEKEIKQAYQAGATMVVVGTAFEDNPAFLVSNSASTSKTVEVSK
ncbi:MULTISPECIES: geranylgeranylglyceryl/heptaprenylglyceryl phosphate synthase [Mesonia]|uniref:Geranylgeranylglyceryl phosphate synthase n=1 Tax=Mesonia oceanica TaxID=2687242 RepID=A0AC61YBI0_9FLAO|nr:MULTISPECIES: geranylgeranylglyceryl/heptaprenylglyceryl phosphate synthase [Mesonia]MAN28460.1 geranylgeranylglyceryl/heptaprenylglyceryl phosphate synthase [Mesonia sp.]MAQ40118.1 geranylgeranylglyceryl/heptaprenylglyceryl phosphate synthase [Mesonia sp.]MBJ98955.1 geranylgeranylglyceryl/heptaprenylglyceryl phosphate synthase [Flavobacteriaceae bacterium]VVV01806.1 Geranylgeranylglyceryl phosphate synthase [Mesonia oceanica]|tara:strand:- start:3010 stop:3759 length:750 start_codon:yes stop_codon:yes gene_type:complete